jgi:cytochrome-b5 reductase
MDNILNELITRSISFVIEIPDNVKPGIRVASAVLLAGAGDGIKDKDGKPVMRPYTPVTTPEDVGHIDFLIKKYSNGPMSSHIHTLKPGDKLGIKGPMDTFAVRKI